MEKLGLQEHKENICPYPPLTKPLSFNQLVNSESFIFNSALAVQTQQNIKPLQKQKRNTKISILNFMEQRKQGKNQQHFNSHKKEKIFIK